MDAILAFHSIDRSGSVLSFPPERLHALLLALLEEGTQIVPLAALLGAAGAPGHRVALTFDDGLSSASEEALPLLRRLAIPALVYVVSGWVGADNRWPSQPAWVPRFPTMSWDQIKAWRDAGLEVGGHTANHVHLNGLGAAQWQEEIDASRARLETVLEIPVRHFAYPYGTVTEEATERVKAVHETAVTTRMDFLTPGTSPHLLPRLDAYYLRGALGQAPLFSLRSRGYLALRRSLRRLRARGAAA